jgi:hypothetical protein
MRVIRFMALLTLTLPWPSVAQEREVASDSVLAVEVASRAVEATPAVGQIWPGFWPENQGFVIRLDRDQALAVLPGGGSPDGWHREPAVIADPRFRAALVIERSLLIDALRCGTCPDRPTLARQYLALRDRRLALGGSRVAATEHHLERKEGTTR